MSISNFVLDIFHYVVTVIYFERYIVHLFIAPVK